MTNALSRRIERLEQSENDNGGGFAQRLAAARARLDGMRPEERVRHDEERWLQMKEDFRRGRLSGLALRIYEADKRMRGR